MLTVPEAARRTGRDPETIRRWIRSGKLRARKVGTQHVIEDADLDALVGEGSFPLPAAWRTTTWRGAYAGLRRHHSGRSGTAVDAARRRRKRRHRSLATSGGFAELERKDLRRAAPALARGSIRTSHGIRPGANRRSHCRRWDAGSRIRGRHRASRASRGSAAKPGRSRTSSAGRRRTTPSTSRSRACSKRRLRRSISEARPRGGPGRRRARSSLRLTSSPVAPSQPDRGMGRLHRLRDHAAEVVFSVPRSTCSRSRAPKASSVRCAS